MQTLWSDLILRIGQYLSDYDKIMFSEISREHNTFKFKFRYRKLIDVTKIYALPMFENFECVLIPKRRKNKYPKNAKRVYFTREKSKVPYGVTHLLYRCCVILTNSCIPSTVRHIDFGDHFNLSINGCVPDTVTELKFGLYFRTPLTWLPSNLTHLILSAFNMPLNGVLHMTSLTYLDLGGSFDQKITDEIPSTVTHLNLGYSFNHPINGLRNTNIKYLKFGCQFNQSIEGNLPESLCSVAFGTEFNRKIDGLIPSSVTDLALGSKFCQKIQLLPTALQKLVIFGNIEQPLMDIVPASVTHLTVKKLLPNALSKGFPETVTHLTVDDHWDRRMVCIDKITHLTLLRVEDKKSNCEIPSSVTHLTVNSCMKNLKIPITVKHLSIGYTYTLDKDTIPASVTHLVLRYHIEGPIENIIPASVTHLTLKWKYDTEKYVIPSTVKYLTLTNPNKPVRTKQISPSTRIKIIDNDSIEKRFLS